MGVVKVKDEGQKLGYPSGKVLGIVDSCAEFDAVVAALASAGFHRIEALCGEDGIALLERVGTFFFSDMEERVLNRHIDELKAGHIIVAISAPSDRVDDAVRLASESGARRLVHFGPLTVTWHTK